MMTPRENYLVAARGGKPERVPVFPFDCNIFAMDFWRQPDPETGRDFCNIKWITNEAGSMPDYRYIAMEDVSQWRETIKFPVVSELDWEGMAKRFRDNQDPNKVNIAMLNTHGLFLIPINMMGWEEGLCALYEQKEEMAALINRLGEFLLELVPYIGKYIGPDIIFTGDDFAATTGPFVSKETFQEMYKPMLTRINDAIHATGALAEFHCCGNNQFLTQEFLETGADIIQLAEPNEALLADKARYGSRLVMTGGWDRHGPGCLPNAPEEVVRESVRTAIDTYGKDGGLIFWDGGIVGKGEDSMQKMKWVVDEAMRYGSIVYKD
jgi:uroporphyrinogen-III decarboxylase